MFNDITPDDVLGEYWTIALVDHEYAGRETHFGVFPSATDARKAMESGRVKVQHGQSLDLRRIRKFPA